MEASGNIETPESSTKQSSPRKFHTLSRSAPLSLSNTRLTPCRRIGLKRKSTPGTAFRSPLKDDPGVCSVVVNSPGFKTEDSHSLMSNNESANIVSSTSSEVSETINQFTVSYPRVTKKFMISTSKTSTPTTPSVSKRLKADSCSLRKVLKLSDGNSTSSSNNNCEQAEVACVNSAELAQVLNKDHSSFMKIYTDFSPEEVAESDCESTLKHETLARMKKMFDQIVGLKAFLQNAKQHDILDLELMTEKWREGCQRALLLWQEKLQQRGLKCEMTQLLQESGIPSKIVRYDEETQDFIT